MSSSEGRGAPNEQTGSSLGGSFSVDGKAVEIDLAEFGWPADRGSADSRGDAGAGSGGSADDDGRVRLQKALAHAGVASRRACEALIAGGRVTVNGEAVRELGSRIDPESDDVRVDGVPVQLDVSKLYYVLNKPRGVVSTMADEQGRPDLQEFVDRVGERLYNVGRLDTDTSGLLVLTNDGELAHRLAHPKFGVQKTYIAKVRGRMTAATVQQLKEGIELDDGPIHVDAAKLLPGNGAKHSLIEVTLHSGRNRIVRRMLAAVGHPVEELVRRQFGPLHLGSLRLGEMRELSHAERGALLSAAEGGDPAITGGRPGDGKGARGMRGVAARGNPHSRASRVQNGQPAVRGGGAGKQPGAGKRSGTGKKGGQSGRGKAGER